MVDDAFDFNDLPVPMKSRDSQVRVLQAQQVFSALRVLSDISQRAQIATAAGLTFDGARDLYTVLGYPRTLKVKDYRDRYKRGDIAARIVEAFPDATWGGGCEIVEDQDPEISTQLEEDVENLNKRLNLWSVFHRADILAGLGEFAVILIGAPGKMETELPKMQSPDDILYLSPYAPDEANIDQYVEKEDDPRYGLPLFYTLQRRLTSTNSGRGQKNFSRRVHWTRIIHVADLVLEDKVFGTPRLEKVWNRLDDLDKVAGGGSEAFWKRVHQGYHWDLAPDVKIGQPQIDKLKEEAEEFEHQMRRTIATRGMKLNVLGSDVSPFNTQVQALISLISGATKIPQRILLGSERGELASTQDRENWNDRVSTRRNNTGTPLVREFVDRLANNGALPLVEEYEVRWPEINTLTEGERADIATKWVALGERVVLPEEVRDQILGLERMDESQIADIEAKEQAANDQKLEIEKLKAQNPGAQPFGAPSPGKDQKKPPKNDVKKPEGES